ncbi:serine-rich adhesin for platelets-like isoform X2 [Heptranchias perlo]|uniref:serine-rich adhesin for platelets-like isoform X2 n=1 Tax=Heptranchias perlo TaxID=212740 RepID=UPI003559452C
MMLSALFVGLFLLFQHATGSTYLFSRGPGDFTTLQCNVPTGAGNKVTWWSTSDLGTEMGKTKCKKKGMKIESCGNNNPQKSKKQNQPECKKHKTNEDRMESQSLTFDVKTSNSMVFTCTAQDFTGNGSSDCLSLVTLTGDGCENHNLFFVIIQSDSDEIFPTKENSMLMTVSEGESVTLPCQFENRKSLPFTLFWITSGNISKCLHSVHIEDYNSHSNTHCCVDRKSEQRISNQNSHNPTDRSQSHNLTIHSAHRVDIGRYLCVVHVQDSGKPVWKIAANVSLAVTGPSAESSDTSTSTSGISSVKSSITPANTERSTYLFSRGPGDFTTLQCNVPTGAGNKVTWWSTSDLGTEMGKTKCKKKGMKIESCGNNNPQKSKKQNQPECKKHKTNEDRMESQSLTFDVKTSNSMVFTCTAQDSTGNGSSDCLSWVTLTGDGCENHNLFFVIIQSDSDEIFLTEENSLSMTVSEGESVTLPCQFENRKSLPFTLFWITSGNISKCLHSVHIEDYNSHSNTRCCVDRKSEQRISNQSSHNPTDRSQSHNLTIHSAHRVDTGRYLCAVNVQDSGKPVWKIAANVSLAVTGPSAESSDTSTSTSGISSVNSSITPANTENPYTRCTDRRMYVLVLYLFVIICIDGVSICIIRRKRQSAKAHLSPERARRGEGEGDRVRVKSGEREMDSNP